ncbi:putative aliphatic sulfonates-binding protein precursor [Oxobacter pfennigii]|uniref:Putative aliphatic sulfonates-binding protein n=1 Tax=Oxobacter pfennigii TaxID=36849 RepID=A0A0P8WEL3_9CLOT|nr:ABC transporter substrate-binding protein [Oxobacter pfennigii]KPU46180.1 putative aliphatic sulfonates-binding protein precursor [Oxobacter pfennigii]
MITKKSSVTKRKRGRLLLIPLFAITLVMTVLAGCSSNQTPSGSTATPGSSTPAPTVEADQSKDFVLRIGYGGSLCEAPLHMAYEKGYFEEEGLKVELTKLAPGTIFDAVTANQVDAGFSLLASLVQPLSNGLPVKITTGLHTGCDKVLAKKDSGITSPADFKGKKVGVPSMTSSPIIFTKRVLADNGIGVGVQNSEVEFVVYSTTDLPIALENGAVDAIAMNDPTATIAANEYDLNVVFDSALDAPYKDQYCCSAFVRENIVTDYPDIAAKYTRAMQKASAWVQENQDEAAKIQVDNKWVAGDAEVNAKVLKTFNYIPSVSGAYDAFGITAKQLQEVGMLDAGVDVDNLHKNSFTALDGIPEEYK